MPKKTKVKAAIMAARSLKLAKKAIRKKVRRGTSK